MIGTSPQEAGLRLDAFLASKIPDVSRARIQRLIEGGLVRLDGQAVRASQRVKAGEKYQVEIPEATPSHLQAQDLPLDILFSDDDLIVLNKPAGLVVHPGAGRREGTLVNALLHHFPGFSVGDKERPGLVHRLDKDTSGVMVVARNDKAYQFLAKAFKSREVHKIYRAFAVGTPKKKEFELLTGHARHRTDRKRFSTRMPPDSAHVRVAHSKFEVLQTVEGITELRVELFTGRTHQIRAHLADIGHPLVQDALYGGARATKALKASPARDAALELKRHALHAETLSFTHPSSLKPVTFAAPLPQDLQMLHDVLARFS